MVELAQKSSCVEANLIRDCLNLRRDVLQAARDLSSPGTDHHLAEIGASYREVGYLMDQLLGKLLNHDFAEVEERLCEINSRMLSVESHPD